ncbi:hypothetical protein A2763_01395 [Candidatus Kaiserbacteria bacterium RIFCSPHIGHO2_01_FULL_54_36]|uniref:DUF5666 domain-containing protein n=1 Tax=Candidatus Kaiserbacteria bacterium RIFCSPHIGHO2_01_FULL_54_36 TaxID=1798482 RepID=A0A1F6CMN5_9BACT|nr:MAG: hypothetical protein A2763_01395 [Candidatus Kaiserbacteria bacterium RIFCSPHIGHO2_01_FULL_54_36]OGG75772.1 MAG: hypothetical protein A3A41_00165 [Candidatus Kaiserbacteria bacterium RIFCSPLOWO2_01_FULL_54_22]
MDRFSSFLQKALAVAGVSIMPLALAAVSTLLFLAGPHLYQGAVYSSANVANEKIEGAFSDVIHQITLQQASALSHVSPVMRQVSIANNGQIFLRGGTVVVASGMEVLVSITWDGVQLPWLVQLSSKTRFFSSDGEEKAFSILVPGDIITVTGTLGNNGKGPIVNAKYIRDSEE